MALDEDGRPVRGAGALPYEGYSGGVGDKSGVAFSTNWMERAPTQNSKGKFMQEFQKMIADVAAGQTAPADIADMPAGEPPRKETASERMKRLWAERKAKGERLGGKKHGRAVAMQKSQVSECAKRAAAGPATVQGDDEGPGVSSNGLSDLPRAGSDSSTGLPEVLPAATSGTPDLQSRIVQAAAQVGMQAFHVNPEMFAQMPLEAALHQLDTLRAQTSALSQMLEERRQNEQGEDLTKCMWCNRLYQPPGHFFARVPFEIPVGSGQWHSVHSCKSATCIGKFNAAVDKIQAEIRAERS